jgi:hypothetical protein
MEGRESFFVTDSGIESAEIRCLELLLLSEITSKERLLIVFWERKVLIDRF